MATLQLPHALRRRECGSIQYVAERKARCPVLLVHGYAASESVWTPLRAALAGGGFAHIVSLTYNSFAMDPEAVSAGVVAAALDTATFAQIATTTVRPDSSALPPSPDRSEK